MSRRLSKKKSRKKSRVNRKSRSRVTPCPPGKVRNPRSGRCITDKKSRVNRRSRSRVTPCPPGKVRNPRSGRCITDKKSRVTPCPPGKVRNPRSGRCITDKKLTRRRTPYKSTKIRSRRSYKNLITRQRECPPGKIQNPKTGRCIKDKIRCKNSNTYIYQNDADSLDKNDLMKINGYCFSITEIIEWIDSGTFNNINPHDLNKTKLFNNFKDVTNTELRKKLEKWLEERIQTDINIANYMINNKRDILLLIGYAGITCLYDNIHSHEREDSSTFEESIEVLGKLSSYINDDVIGNLKISENYTLKNLINDANSGNKCIHGIGILLLELFFNLISIIQNTNNNKNIKILTTEDFIKLNFFLVKDKNKNVVIFKIDNRLVCDSNSVYYRTKFDFLQKIPNISSLITPIDKINDIISSIFTEQCQNEPDLVSNDTVEYWKDIPIWRRIKTTDNYCFDLLFLIKIIGLNLDNSISANPYPIYPKNIFTNKRLSNIDLINIKRRINNNINLYKGSLALFLNSPELWSEDNNYVTSSAWRERVIRLFENKLRFVRYFDKIDIDNDGQRIAIIAGYWDDKNSPASSIEINCIQYLNTFNINYVLNLRRITVNYYKFPNIENMIDNSNTKLFF